VARAGGIHEQVPTSRDRSGGDGGERRARSGRLVEHGREQPDRRERPRADHHRARALQDPAVGDHVVHEGDGREGQLRRHGLGRDAYEARRREHGAHLHRRRRRIRLVDLASTDAAFKSGGKTYAACFANDFRISIYNKKLFAKAGITTFPRTLTELGQDADKLKAAGVQYPLSIPMAATEGGVTPWYLLTLANGGNLFDSNFKPTFQKPGSAGYKALQWEALAVKNGWVSPGSVSLDDSTAFDKFTAGQTAMVLATGPGNLETANDKSQSSIAGQAVAALVPGANGPEASFGLPEGLSIPVTAKHKAAAAAFIEWWQKPANAIAIYKQEGNLPCGSSVIKQLSTSGQLAGGKVLGQELKLVKPLFPQGAPIWYSQFSADAQGLLNAAVKGQMSISGALSQLASKATAHASA